MKKGLALAALGLSIGLFFRLDRSPTLGAEDGSYIALGKALADGHGYVNDWLEPPVRQTKYAIGFPLLLAPVEAVFDLSFAAFRLLVVLFALVAVGTALRLFSDLDGEAALLTVFLLAFSRSFRYYATWIGPETPFMAALLIAVFFASRWAREERALTRTGLLAFAAFCAAYFIRPLAAVLIPALGVSLLLVQPKKLGALAAFLLPIAAWSLFTRGASAATGGSYYQAFSADPYAGAGAFAGGSLAAAAVKNVYALTFYAAPRILTGVQPEGRRWLAAAASLLPAIGLAASLRREKAEVAHWCFFFYAAVLAVWPWTRTSGERYLYPASPFVFFYFVRGAALLARGRLRPVGAVCVLVALVNLCQARAAQPERAREGAEEREYYAAARWVGEHSAAGERVFGFASPSFYLFSGRKASGLSCPYSSESLRAAARESGVRLAFVSDESPGEIIRCFNEPFRALARARPGEFPKVHGTNGNDVFAVR